MATLRSLVTRIGAARIGRDACIAAASALIATSAFAAPTELVCAVSDSEGAFDEVYVSPIDPAKDRTHVYELDPNYVRPFREVSAAYKHATRELIVLVNPDYGSFRSRIVVVDPGTRVVVTAGATIGPAAGCGGTILNPCNTIDQFVTAVCEVR
jgi:hypothetical protein